MKILVDMNLSPTWVEFLTEAGYEAVHWSETGSARATDLELMTWAAEHNYVILTADLDFGAMLAASKGNSPSVVQVRSDILTPPAIGTAVIRALTQAKQELIDGALVSVETARAQDYACCRLNDGRQRTSGEPKHVARTERSEIRDVIGTANSAFRYSPRCYGLMAHNVQTESGIMTANYFRPSQRKLYSAAR